MNFTKLKDISEFKPNDCIKTISGFAYKVLKINYISNGKTVKPFESILLNLHTNQTSQATWLNSPKIYMHTEPQSIPQFKI